jgi:hypothetical protein
MSRPEVRAWVAAALVASVVACKGSESSSSTPSQPTVDPGTKGMNVLGAGTDVFGEYAVEANVKGRLLDVEALNRDGKLVYSPNIEESKYVEAAGSVISEYATSLSASVGLTGNYKFFSAEMRAAFSQDTYRREDYSYASIIERHWKHSLKVEPRSPRPRSTTPTRRGRGPAPTSSRRTART